MGNSCGIIVTLRVYVESWYYIELVWWRTLYLTDKTKGGCLSGVEWGMLGDTEDEGRWFDLRSSHVILGFPLVIVPKKNTKLRVCVQSSSTTPCLLAEILDSLVGMKCNPSWTSFQSISTWPLVGKTNWKQLSHLYLVLMHTMWCPLVFVILLQLIKVLFMRPFRDYLDEFLNIFIDDLCAALFQEDPSYIDVY